MRNNERILKHPEPYPKTITIYFDDGRYGSVKFDPDLFDSVPMEKRSEFLSNFIRPYIEAMFQLEKPKR